MHSVATTATLTLLLCAHAACYREYYLKRYSEFIDYKSYEDQYGIYHEEGYANDPLPIKDRPVYTGCSEDAVTKKVICNSKTVQLKFLSETTLGNELFGSQIERLIITDCANLERIEDGAFDHITKLDLLQIQNTGLSHVPDVSRTNIKKLNLAGNAIKMDTENYRGWSLPKTLVYMNLAENKIHWIPDGFIAGSKLLMVSLSYNDLPNIIPGIFGDLPKLKFLGLDGNELTSITRLSLSALDSDKFKHLNLSNNKLSEIQPGSFSSMPGLMLLELHRNELSRIHPGVFHDLTELRHLDLHMNKLKRLKSQSFKNLPNLRELRLHSQDPPMTVIEYDAWENIGQNIRDLHADGNRFSNLSVYSAADFPPEKMSVYYSRVQSVVPFSAYPNIRRIRLMGNLITSLQQSDFCGGYKVVYLHLGYNKIQNMYMDDESLTCLERLTSIELNNNRLQYVPRCFATTHALRMLERVFLEYNYITFIPEGAFSNLPALYELRLDHNLIMTVENGAFPDNIEIIDLGFNNFRFHHDRIFNNLRKVSYMDIQENQIDYLPLNAFYNCCISLDYLYMCENKIPELRVQHFEWIEHLRYLSACNNSIGWIEDGAFAGIHSAVNFDFYNNKLTRVPRSFANTTISSELDFRENLIHLVPSYAFENMQCPTIHLSSNPIITIEAYALAGFSGDNLWWPMYKLRTVYSNTFHGLSVANFDLTGARLEHLEEKTFSSFKSTTAVFLSSVYIDTIDPEAFYDVTIHDLHLQFNGLTAITGPMFGGVSDVTGTVYLNHNSIEQISHNAFANVSIWGLSLNHNRLTDIPRAIHYRPFVHIAINDNQITQIPHGSLVGLSHLKVLYLTGNQVTFLEPGVFDNLPSLIELDISSNSIEYLKLGVFDNIPTLEILRIASNKLTHLHALHIPSLQQLEAQHNTIATMDVGTFSDNPLLHTVDLDGNPLECDCEMIKTLDIAKNAEITGACAENPEAAGVMISGDGLTYRKVRPSVFMCSARNITGQAISADEITVQWYHPTVSFFNVYETSPTPSGAVLYTITCASQSFPKLTTTLASTILTTSEELSTTITGAEPSSIYECSVQIEYGGTTSARSSPTVVKTHENVYSVSPGDTLLEVTFHDFSTVNKDFDNLEFIPYTNVSYVASPYGAWLAVSDTPELDTFSSWFRHDPMVNYEFQDTIPLSNLSPTKQRSFTSNFYPLEGKGFGSERQKDCDNDYHNFGFTTAIRTGLVFSGQEVITVAGGEGLWLFINKIKLLEHTASGTAESIPCFVIDLAPAARQGGTIFLQSGYILAGEECTLVNTSSTGIPLELQLGMVYHFDLFHAETRTCSSEFLLELENVSLQSNPLVQSPLDDFLFVDEDLEVGGVVDVLPTEDVFSGSNFTITLLRGNEGRRFLVLQTPANITRSPQDFREMTDLQGDTITFLECAENVSSNVPLPYNTSAETFHAGVGPVYLTVANPLDYEQVTEYELSFSVVDNTKGLTGYIYLQIKVVDVNDNCPIITSIERSLPQPVLRKKPLLVLNGTDADSGRNADMRYVLSSLLADPARDCNTNLDYWDDVSVGYTTLSLYIIAIDNGSIPRGSIVPFNITMSTSCLIDPAFGNISTVFNVDNITNELTLRIPGYYLYEYDCDELAGMSNWFLPGSWITASSTYHPKFTKPDLARLNVSASNNGFSGGWVAGLLDTDQYLQLDMQVVYRFNEVHIQGRSDADEWVTSFRIWYDVGNGTWTQYRHSDGREIFSGTTDRSTIVVHTLDPVIISQRIRLNPQTWNTNISMRAEFKGCLRDKKMYFDTHCMRCETSYYCRGDGERHMCGRCENKTATCHKDPTEHSFGKASQCSPCPSGWICKDGKALPCAPLHYANCSNSSCPDTCTHCEPGYACCSGKRIQCRPGTYSDGNIAMCALCTPGTYQDQYAMSTCKPCAPGYYSEYGKSTCSLCPSDYYTTGVQCLLCKDANDCPCLGIHTCFTTSLCYNTGLGGYDCLPCPAGFYGDGRTCTDIDECNEHSPCFEERCVNTAPGYQCLECPEGYKGTYEDAYTWTLHRRVYKYRNLELANLTYQTCNDINECETDNGGCEDQQMCVNTIGSFYCRPTLQCKGENTITDSSGCDFCALGLHNCSRDAMCAYIGPTRFKCTCKMGYAGNGIVCGRDTDLDGFPDASLPCDEWECSQDNCLTIPNSMQENHDGDSYGNACDFDDDNDRLLDYMDNCVTVANFDQIDTDGDGFGNACDTCTYDSDVQRDSDGDGEGDYCDRDDDDDGIYDEDDNCDFDINPGQEDSDGDGVGDACDNCINDPNSDQYDENLNWQGDACDNVTDYDKDNDGDGTVDVLDNCPNILNGDQADTDRDSIGDACDDDIDNDGIPNELDNCPYLSNSNQADVNSDTIGDACETDTDGDGIDDTLDYCPKNPDISSLDVSRNVMIDLNLKQSWEPLTKYLVNGTEVKQTVATKRPHMLIAKQKYSDIEYEGTWYVSNTSAIDYIGLVFGYRNIQQFYTVLWKRQSGNFRAEFSTWDPAIKGLQIKLMDAFDSPGYNITRALWHSSRKWLYSWPLWHDLEMIPWEPETAYRWQVTFRPSIGLIRSALDLGYSTARMYRVTLGTDVPCDTRIALKVYKGNDILVDSGPVYDMFLTGGRVGVLQFGEFPMIWSNLKVTCLEDMNKALYLNGIADYVSLDDIFTIQMDASFTLEVYVMLDLTYTQGPYPIFSSVDGDICLWIANGYIYGQYSYHKIQTSKQLTGGTWYDVMYRYDAKNKTLSIFIDGVREAHKDSVWYVNWYRQSSNMTMLIGKSSLGYLRGKIDEFRLFCVAVEDTDIENYIEMISTQQQVTMHQNTLYFRMEDSENSPTLVNTGWMTFATAQRHGGKFVKSQQHSHRHGMKYTLQHYSYHD